MREKHPRTTGSTPTVKIDRAAFREYLGLIGHTETSLGEAYSSGTYICHRFSLYDGNMPETFITWCNRLFPSAQEKLKECIVPKVKQEEPKAEQISMTLPSVTRDKIVTIQPVSLMGFNQLVDALNLIADRLQKLEEAWKGSAT